MKPLLYLKVAPKMLVALVPEVMTKASTSDVRMRSSEKKFHLNIWNTTSNTLKNSTKGSDSQPLLRQLCKIFAILGLTISIFL